jgi:hypothetical protein
MILTDVSISNRNVKISDFAPKFSVVRLYQNERFCQISSCREVSPPGEVSLGTCGIRLRSGCRAIQVSAALPRVSEVLADRSATAFLIPPSASVWPSVRLA